MTHTFVGIPQRDTVSSSRPPLSHSVFLSLSSHLAHHVANMAISIRPMAAEDKSQFLVLWEKYNVFYKRTVAAAITDKTWERMLDPQTRLYGAVAVDSDLAPGANIVGFVTWLPHFYTATVEDIVYLHDLYVSEDVRNGGVGRSLINHVYDWCKQEGITSVYWHTQRFNHRAQLLYTKVANLTDFVQYKHDV